LRLIKKKARSHQNERSIVGDAVSLGEKDASGETEKLGMPNGGGRAAKNAAPALTCVVGTTLGRRWEGQWDSHGGEAALPPNSGVFRTRVGGSDSDERLESAEGWYSPGIRTPSPATGSTIRSTISGARGKE